jgi:hypothetical protein
MEHTEFVENKQRLSNKLTNSMEQIPSWEAKMS